MVQPHYIQLHTLILHDDGCGTDFHEAENPINPKIEVAKMDVETI